MRHRCIEKGVIAASTPEAVEAGIEILRVGGNAIDAAVAVSFALAVTEPACSGLGGQGFFMIHPDKGSPFTVNGSSVAPLKIPEKITAKDLAFHRATTVPSMVRLLEYVWKEWGSGLITWQRLIEPAIRFAEDGYLLGSFRRLTLMLFVDRLRKNPVTKDLFLNSGWQVPPLRSIIRQPVLARTLRRIADRGADDFYEGEIAREIASDMAQHDGWITFEDLRTLPKPTTAKALKGTYRAWDVFTLPPPSGGWSVLQALNMLEKIPPLDFQENRGKQWVWFAEALRICQKKRRKKPLPIFKDKEEIIFNK
ncbi:MAG: gamma-glutamyltransferase, partial [Thermodesulfobacteriota bacterium]|nr:gamma-glutamyltransferase [Thermodesulfobacteriota bacterium]